jgi:hypothetical protein
LVGIDGNLRRKDLLNRDYIVLQELESKSLVYSVAPVDDPSQVYIISSADAFEKYRLKTIS